MRSSIWLNPITWVVAAVVSLYLLFAVVGYFGMVGKRNNYDRTVGDVQTALQLRFDTIPNFVKTAKFSLDEQEKIITENAAIREHLDTAKKTSDNGAAVQAIDDYHNLLVNVRTESVASPNIAQLTELNAEIESVERVINHQRNAVNQACNDYRNSVQGFPGVLIRWATSFNSSYCQYFQADQAAQKSPGVDFNK
jgi:LemA protein